MALIRISSVNGNSQKLDGGSMYGNAPRTVWEKWSPPDSLGRIDLACRAMLVEIDHLKILCETGIGAFFDPKLAERYGVQNPESHVLLDSLNTLGITPNDIDYVILSHLHFDHAGGLLPAYKEHIQNPTKLVFSKAQYIVGKEAWERAKNPHPRDRASFIPAIVNNLENSGRLILINTAKDLPTEISSYFAFYISQGHTPGQTLSIVKGSQRSVVFTGDLIPGSSWVHLPITMGYDRYPELLINEKQELYEQLTEDKDLLFFTHDTSVVAASFQKDSHGKYRIHQPYTKLERLEI